jgi:hypothetical protein
MLLGPEAEVSSGMSSRGRDQWRSWGGVPITQARGGPGPICAMPAASKLRSTVSRITMSLGSTSAANLKGRGRAKG